MFNSLLDSAVENDQFIAIRKGVDRPPPSRVQKYLRKAAEGLPHTRYRAAAGWRETLQPVMVNDATQITGTTETLLWGAQYSSTYANFFTPAKAVKVTAWGRMTTASATPGNLTLTVRYGTTTGGTSLGASAASALAISQTNITWWLEVWVICRGIGSGSAGLLMAAGRFHCGPGTTVLTAGTPISIPATAIATTAMDTTSAQGIVVTGTLGAAGDTMTTHMLFFEALT